MNHLPLRLKHVSVEAQLHASLGVFFAQQRKCGARPAYLCILLSVVQFIFVGYLLFIIIRLSYLSLKCIILLHKWQFNDFSFKHSKYWFFRAKKYRLIYIERPRFSPKTNFRNLELQERMVTVLNTKALRTAASDRF